MKHAAVAAVLVVAAVVVVGACKKTSRDAEPEAVTDDDGAIAEGPTNAAGPPPAEPDLDDEVIPDAPADAAPPAPAVPLSAAPTVLYDATSGAVTAGTWTVDATDVRFDVAPIGVGAETADVEITMSSGGRSARVHTCRGLSRVVEGDVTAQVSESDAGVAQLTVNCFTRTELSAKGSSSGVHVRWSSEGRVAQVADRFQIEGRPDTSSP